MNIQLHAGGTRDVLRGKLLQTAGAAVVSAAEEQNYARPCLHGSRELAAYGTVPSPFAVHTRVARLAAAQLP